MVARLGQVLYWAGSALAVLLAGAALFAYQNALDQFVVWVAGIAAALSWLSGRALLYILAGR